ncbi:hypothetical protein [Streptomyces marincola]|uniref:Uncharacterized protein n=1 Tax=Streptomyces marincola TaxID=2878388 RepID=A0A1W7CZ53_9ACTN|nr:hypothetical protein [Streptomyces marincola]ARQ69987.1 hypothetical protein CAG99_14980 [Streptomyces marincola]
MTAAPETAPPGNEQHVGQGAAIVGDVHGDVLLVAADERVVKPRFREGPYPADDVAERLRAFAEPPSFARCREILARRRVLLLAGAPGTGVGTAAFALLRGGTDRVIGCDPGRHPGDLKLAEAAGHLLRALPAESAAALTDVTLAALQERLHAAGSLLVVVVDPALPPPAAANRWLVHHQPPAPADVARAHLRSMDLPEGQLHLALEHLEAPQIKAYLDTSRTPAVGAEVAAELRHIALGARDLHEALDNLTRTAAERADDTLRAVRHDPAALALTASVALLEHRDRTVITRCAAELRPLLAPPQQADPPDRLAKANVLGDDLATRLRRVDAHALPRVIDTGSRYWYRYRVEPIAFQRRHQADAILARLWLDHDGVSEALLSWLGGDTTRYSPGLDSTAGRAIGRVLRQATGPDVFRQLRPLAGSPHRWRRRLVAYALSEAAQDGVLAGAVRDQLRQWSRHRDEHVRATVAETCAGGFGLIRPDRTLRLLDRVLDGPAGSGVRTGVSLALTVLLSETANAEAVLAAYTDWSARPEGSEQRAYALRAVPELITNHLQLDLAPGPLLPLVRRALDDAGARDNVVAALLAAEDAPEAGTRARATAFITALAGSPGTRRGVRALLIARRHHRGRSEEPLSQGALA